MDRQATAAMAEMMATLNASNTSLQGAAQVTAAACNQGKNTELKLTYRRFLPTGAEGSALLPNLRPLRRGLKGWIALESPGPTTGLADMSLRRRLTCEPDGT